MRGVCRRAFRSRAGMERYVKQAKLGEGAQGVIYRAQRRDKLEDQDAAAEATAAGAGESSQALDSSDEDEVAAGEVKLAAGALDSWERADPALRAHFPVVPKDEFPDVVAVKRVRVLADRGGVSLPAVRELKLLQELRHPNIVRLLDVYVHKNDVNLVLEYLEGDLERVIRDGDLLLREEQVKHYMLMLLRGLEHCHRNWVLHRDIKPSNLLIAANGELKITDFGLAKVYGSPERNLSPQACTRWYRAPELLFGSRAYGAAADIWSAGCVFAELMIRVPLFSGDSDIDQLSKIFACLGTPRESDWPAMKELPDFLPFEPVPPTPLRAIFPAASADALDLLAQMLRFSPAARPSASDALRHRYFTAPPHPAPLDQMPRVRKRDAPVK